MKKLTRAAALITVILSFWMLAAGCAAIPAPKKAEEKLRNAGYKVSVYDGDDPVSTYMESDERIEIHLYSMIFANDSSFDKAKGDFIFIFYFETKDDFFEQADRILNPKDTVLVKASNGMKFSEIVSVLKER